MIIIPSNIDAFILAAATATGVPVDLIRSIAYVESRFNPSVVSPKGAIGIMQLMPQTAESLGVSNPYDPEENIYGAAKLLDKLYKEFGSWEPVVAAYNWGASNVRKNPDRSKWPVSVLNYVKKVENAVMALQSGNSKNGSSTKITLPNVNWAAVGVMIAAASLAYSILGKS